MEVLRPYVRDTLFDFWMALRQIPVLPTNQQFLLGVDRVEDLSGRGAYIEFLLGFAACNMYITDDSSVVLVYKGGEEKPDWVYYIFGYGIAKRVNAIERGSEESLKTMKYIVDQYNEIG